jgi:DNA modification methylase
MSATRVPTASGRSVLADNRLAEKAGWDDELLAIELQYLVEIDTDFEVEITGFETAEIDALVGSLGSPDDAAEDEVPPINDQSPAITRPGDLWLMGKHRLQCGSALDPESYAVLLGGAQARMVFTDPPWNVPVNGHVCGSGRIKHREFAMATGEMSEDEFTEFLERVLTNLASHCVDGAILDVCMDWRHIGELLTASRRAGLQYLNLCVWNKDNGGMGSFYRSKHELIGIFKIGAAQHINNIQLGRFGRYRTNVWDYAGVNTLRKGRLDDLSMHPTVKPVALVADAIKDCTRRGDIVLDAFMGSGTTVIAAERTGRVAYGLELDPLYVDTAVRRWEAYTGGHAIHERTRLTFGEVAGSHEARASMMRRVRHRSRASLGSVGAK